MTDIFTSQWHELRTNFLLPIVAAVPLSLLANSWTSNSFVFKGQPLSVLIPLVACALAFAIWVSHQGKSQIEVRTRIFIMGLVTLWVWTFILDHARNTSMNYSTFVVPVTLVLIFVKRPSAQQITTSMDLLGWSTIAVTVAHEVLTYLHGTSTETGATLFSGLAWNRAIDTSWHGPFEYVSFAGIAGAFLLLYGLTRKSLTRLVFVGFGLLLVYEAGQLTPILGILSGLLVFAVFILPRRMRISNFTAALLVIAGEIALFTCAIAVNKTLSGRTDIYVSYLQLWKSNLFTGVGYPGINQAMNDGLIPSWIHDAHNIFIDIATKYGLIGLVLLIAVLIASITLEWGQATKGRLTGFVVGLAFISMGMLESFGNWNYLTLPWTWMILATLWSSSFGLTKQDSI